MRIRPSARLAQKLDQTQCLGCKAPVWQTIANMHEIYCQDCKSKINAAVAGAEIRRLLDAQA